MFQFPALPIISDNPFRDRIPIQTSPVQSLRAARRGISQLVASFIGILSQVIHLTVSFHLMHGLININLWLSIKL